MCQWACGGYAYVRANLSSLAQRIHLRIAQEVLRAKASAESTTMRCKSVFDNEQMYEAMRALVGERPHDVKKILGVGNNVEVRLSCMLFVRRVVGLAQGRGWVQLTNGNIFGPNAQHGNQPRIQSQMKSRCF